MPFNIPPRDNVAATVLSLTQQDPRYSSLFQALLNVDPVKIKMQPGLYESGQPGTKVWGDYSPKNKEVRLGQQPIGIFPPDELEDRYRNALAHELTHHLMSQRIPFYNYEEKSSIPYDQRRHERVARMMQRGPGTIPQRPPTDNREELNDFGLLKMLLLAR